MYRPVYFYTLLTENKEMLSFKSDFAEDDIEKCLDEIL